MTRPPSQEGPRCWTASRRRLEGGPAGAASRVASPGRALLPHHLRNPANFKPTTPSAGQSAEITDKGVGCTWLEGVALWIRPPGPGDAGETDQGPSVQQTSQQVALLISVPATHARPPLPPPPQRPPQVTAYFRPQTLGEIFPECRSTQVSGTGM